MPHPRYRLAVDLPVERAGPDDAPALLRLREEAEHWMLARGIDQWHHGEVTLERVAQQVEDSQWHLVRSGEQVVASSSTRWRRRRRRSAGAETSVWTSEQATTFLKASRSLGSRPCVRSVKEPPQRRS